MRILGIASVVLAVATLYALADSELGALAYYSLMAFLCAFLGYCWGSIERLREQMADLQRREARTGESVPTPAVEPAANTLARPAVTSTARTVARVALALIAGAWICRLVWTAVPPLDRAVNHAAEALYLVELDLQRDAVPVVAPPTVESIAVEVHRRTVRVLLWIGLGLGLCLVGALSDRWRRAAIVASSVVFVAGWILLDAYAHVGIVHGLDLKFRLVQADAVRLLQFAIVDLVLPPVVASAGLATLFTGLTVFRTVD